MSTVGEDYPEICENTHDLLKDYINAKRNGLKIQITKSSKVLEKYILFKFRMY